MWENVDRELKITLYVFSAAILCFLFSWIGLLNLSYNSNGGETTIGIGAVLGMILLIIAFIIFVIYTIGKKEHSTTKTRFMFPSTSWITC